MKTTAYIRRSTAKQALSVERQKEQMIEYANNNNIEISDWAIEEPISGKAPLSERPALNEAIFNLNKGDQLLALNVSRVARDEIVFYSVLQALNKRKAELILADGSKGNLMIGLMVIFAAAERQAISARTKQALKVARSKGRAMGRPSRVEYGFQYNNGWLEKNETEQSIIAEIMSLRHSGNTYASIVDKLAERGHTNRLGNRFSIVTVGRIVRRHANPAV